ncbi:DUF4817 domain-containing protein [Trichonephila clavipes]|nr:DUF4817 domain-containing protein [Trichonephila clavipes]
MATSKQKAFCVLQFAKTESAITEQRAFRIKLDCQPPNDNNILRWYHQFETTSYLCKGDDKGCNWKPTVTGSTYLDALQIWLISQLEESEPNNFICQHRLTGISQYVIGQISIYTTNGLATKSLPIKLVSHGLHVHPI